MRIKTKSGVDGWQDKLQNVYSSFEEFEACSDCYGLSTRLGYKTARQAWDDNPTVQGSVNPSDYCKVET